MNIYYEYCTPFKNRERQSPAPLTILLPFDVYTNRVWDGAEYNVGVPRTIDSTELQEYPQLQGRKATVKRTKGTATRDENIINLTVNRMDYLT